MEPSYMSSSTPVTSLYGGTQNRRLTVSDLKNAKANGEKWPMITCYDAITANIFDDAGFPVLLVGDSAAMVVFGFDSTIPVTVEHMIMLSAAVVRGSSRAMVVVDLPFGSYQESADQSLHTSIRLMKEAGVHAVKIEGGDPVISQVRAITEAGIPVFGHLGLTPQSVHQMGGYKVQGRGDAGQDLVRQAIDLEEAGASAIVLEVIPATVAKEISDAVSIPTIGIGAGADTDAQVLVWQDLLGLSLNKPAKFVKQYAHLADTIREASTRWASDVVTGAYPAVEHTYE